MKPKHLPFILLTPLLINLVSCNKEKDDEASDYEKKIQGKWQVKNITIKNNYSGVESSQTYKGSSADFFDFRTDGKMYSEFQGKRDTANYYIEQENNKINFDGDNVAIRELTDYSLILFNKNRTASIGYIEITYVLAR